MDAANSRQSARTLNMDLERAAREAVKREAMMVVVDIERWF
jgi:hypothetical protein